MAVTGQTFTEASDLRTPLAAVPDQVVYKMKARDVNVFYGENEHHVLESIFKSVGRALNQAVFIEADRRGVRSSKGVL